jgi:hypothetical protein
MKGDAQQKLKTIEPTFRQRGGPQQQTPNYQRNN